MVSVEHRLDRASIGSVSRCIEKLELVGTFNQQFSFKSFINFSDRAKEFFLSELIHSKKNEYNEVIDPHLFTKLPLYLRKRVILV